MGTEVKGRDANDQPILGYSSDSSAQPSSVELSGNRSSILDSLHRESSRSAKSTHARSAEIAERALEALRVHDSGALRKLLDSSDDDIAEAMKLGLSAEATLTYLRSAKRVSGIRDHFARMERSRRTSENGARKNILEGLRQKTNTENDEKLVREFQEQKSILQDARTRALNSLSRSRLAEALAVDALSRGDYGQSERQLSTARLHESNFEGILTDKTYRATPSLARWKNDELRINTQLELQTKHLEYAERAVRVVRSGTALVGGAAVMVATGGTASPLLAALYVSGAMSLGTATEAAISLHDGKEITSVALDAAKTTFSNLSFALLGASVASALSTTVKAMSNTSVGNVVLKEGTKYTLQQLEGLGKSYSLWLRGEFIGPFPLVEVSSASSWLFSLAGAAGAGASHLSAADPQVRPIEAPTQTETPALSIEHRDSLGMQTTQASDAPTTSTDSTSQHSLRSEQQGAGPTDHSVETPLLTPEEQKTMRSSSIRRIEDSSAPEKPNTTLIRTNFGSIRHAAFDPDTPPNALQQKSGELQSIKATLRLVEPASTKSKETTDHSVISASHLNVDTPAPATSQFTQAPRQQHAQETLPVGTLSAAITAKEHLATPVSAYPQVAQSSREAQEIRPGATSQTLPQANVATTPKLVAEPIEHSREVSAAHDQQSFTELHATRVEYTRQEREPLRNATLGPRTESLHSPSAMNTRENTTTQPNQTKAEHKIHATKTPQGNDEVPHHIQERLDQTSRLAPAPLRSSHNEEFRIEALMADRERKLKDSRLKKQKQRQKIKASNAESARQKAIARMLRELLAEQRAERLLQRVALESVSKDQDPPSPPDQPTPTPPKKPRQGGRAQAFRSLRKKTAPR